MPEVWNMNCICCRSVFHLSYYMTKPVSSAAASWVHRVKSLKHGKVTSSLCSVRGQHIIREEIKQTAKSPWCWSSPICHLQALACWTFSVCSGASATWRWTHMTLRVCSEPHPVLGSGTGGFRKHPHQLQQGRCFIPRVLPRSCFQMPLSSGSSITTFFMKL